MDGSVGGDASKRCAPEKQEPPRKGKRNRGGDAKAGKPNAGPSAKIDEIREDVSDLRRKVAHESDVARVEQRLGVLENKIEYIAQTVHYMHCMLEQSAQRDSGGQYMSGY